MRWGYYLLSIIAVSIYYPSLKRIASASAKPSRWQNVAWSINTAELFEISTKDQRSNSPYHRVCSRGEIMGLISAGTDNVSDGAKIYRCT